MTDKIYIIKGLIDFLTAPAGVLNVIDGKVVLNKQKAFNRSRIMRNAGSNMERILRRGLVSWGAERTFDFEDEGYWPVMREYVQILHQPYQGESPPPGADVWFEIFDGCSEDWMYQDYAKARRLIREAFDNLGHLPYVKFGVGNECNLKDPKKKKTDPDTYNNLRAWVRECVFPEFKQAGKKPFAYGAMYKRQNPPGKPGALEWQKYEAEKIWNEKTALAIYRPVHHVRDEMSGDLTDTVDFWVRHPICTIWSDDGVFDGDSIDDFAIYNGKTQRRPSPEQIKKAMKYWMDYTKKFDLADGQIKFGFEHCGKAVNNDLVVAKNIVAISKAYFDQFGKWPENFGKYLDDWIVPVIPPVIIDDDTEPLPEPKVKITWQGWLGLAVISIVVILAIMC